MSEQELNGRFLRPWLEESFARRMPFADMVRELVGGQGSTNEKGGIGFVLAYQRDIEALTSVTSRGFLGVQIQCAQCHDHPYEDWTQADYNGLAGFFTTLRQRRVDPKDRSGPPEFRVYDADKSEERKDGLRRLAAYIRRARDRQDESMDDEDGDLPMGRALVRAGLKGELSEETMQKYLDQLPPEIQERIKQAREREKKYGTARFLGGQEFRPTLLSTPREALAEWIVDPDNPYFSRSIVNRLWSHCFGKGLTEPVDDLTGSHDRVLPQLLDTLADQFQENGTDLYFLLGTLVRTEAYALSAVTESVEEDVARRTERYFAAHPVRPLSTEQMLHSLLRVTVTERALKRRQQQGEAPAAARARLLYRFKQSFGGEGTTEDDSFESGIPQALFLMNGRLTNDAVHVRKNAVISEVLRTYDKPRDRITQLFYATLNRPPTGKEMRAIGRLVKRAGKGGKGVEDLYWSLLNSSEFLTNH